MRSVRVEGSRALSILRGMPLLLLLCSCSPAHPQPPEDPRRPETPSTASASATATTTSVTAPPASTDPTEATLAKLPGEVAAALRVVLDRKRDVRDRVAAAANLRSLRAPEAVELLIGVIDASDTDYRISAAAIDALGATPDLRCEEHLTALRQDPKRDKRLRAAAHVAPLPGSRAPRLLRLLADTNAPLDIRCGAAGMIALYPGEDLKSIVPALAALITSTSEPEELRDEAAYALDAMGREACPLLPSPTQQCRAWALEDRLAKREREIDSYVRSDNVGPVIAILRDARELSDARKFAAKGLGEHWVLHKRREIPAAMMAILKNIHEDKLLRSQIAHEFFFHMQDTQEFRSNGGLVTSFISFPSAPRP